MCCWFKTCHGQFVLRCQSHLLFFLRNYRFSVGTNIIKERVAVDVGTFFGVFWDAGLYPQASSSCGGITTCQVRSDSTCLCDTTVQTVAVFDGSFKPTVEQLLSQLHIGSIDSSLLSANYSKCPDQICSSQTEYELWTINQVTDFASAFDADTIFKLTDPMTSEGLFLSNTKSTVSVGGGMSFRNPPMFNSPVDPTQNQALLETDEIIRTYVRHPNTGELQLIRASILTSLLYFVMNNCTNSLACLSAFIITQLHSLQLS